MVLRRHLKQNESGEQIIHQYQEDKPAGGQALLDYLAAHLPKDQGLLNDIARALGGRDGQTFITCVNGGSNVRDIFNIGQLEKLTFNLSLIIIVFTSVWQVLAALFGATAIGLVVIAWSWLGSQPARMTGDFNIAVADFTQVGEGDQIAPIISQRIFSYLDGQYKSSSFQNVQVAHDRIGLVHSAEEALRLAKKVNAHLVIYGDVAVRGDEALVSPQFYVVRGFQNDLREVNGEHQLATRVKFLVNRLLDPADPAFLTLQENASILTEFTKALVFLSAGEQIDLALARESILTAISESENQGEFAGKEVLYLIASDIARRQGQLDAAQAYIDTTLRLNPHYGRGHIAQANIYYDSGDLFRAREVYLGAAKLENQPYGAYIQEKASMGIGNSCTVQFLHASQNSMAQPAEITHLANCALENYDRVVEAYQSRREPDEQFKEMASWAYYQMGLIYQGSGQPDLAEDALKQAAQLASSAELREKVGALLSK